MTEFVEAGHLGGYIAGGDDATYYPDLWRWLVEKQGVRSVIDVGCGEGHALEFFKSIGCFVRGVDGVPQPGLQNFVCHDYARGAYEAGLSFDLAWCCEFVEHVEERYVPSFLASFACANLVLLTHAEPGQQGHHHVNCQPADYWVGVMAAVGFALDPHLTSQARAVASANESPHNHFVRSGMAFQSRRRGG